MCLQWFWQPYHIEIHDTYESVLNDLEQHMRNPCKMNITVNERKSKEIKRKKILKYHIKMMLSFVQIFSTIFDFVEIDIEKS